jgi:phage N-6-adenine-methyltransferase
LKHVSSTKFQAWRTPEVLGRALVREYECVLDAAADADNALCPVFYDGTDGSDGLKQPWNAPGAGVWCNPPYEDPGAWLDKAYHEVFVDENCTRAVFLLPAAVGVSWFTKTCRLAEVFLFDNRIRYELPPREALPPEFQDVLYRRTKSGAWVPKTSPGGGNALVVVEKGGLVGVTGLRSSLTGELLQDFTEGFRIDP